MGDDPFTKREIVSSTPGLWGDEKPKLTTCPAQVGLRVQCRVPKMQYAALLTFVNTPAIRSWTAFADEHDGIGQYYSFLFYSNIGVS